MYVYACFRPSTMVSCLFATSLTYIYILHIYICYHQSSRKPQHSKWNCVGTNKPRHIHMNTPKIRIVQKTFPIECVKLCHRLGWEKLIPGQGNCPLGREIPNLHIKIRCRLDPASSSTMMEEESMMPIKSIGIAEETHQHLLFKQVESRHASIREASRKSLASVDWRWQRFDRSSSTSRGTRSSRVSSSSAALKLNLPF